MKRLFRRCEDVGLLGRRGASMIESLAQCGGEGERTKSNRTVSRCGYSAVISVATAYDAGPTVSVAYHWAEGICRSSPTQAREYGEHRHTAKPHRLSPERQESRRLIPCS